MGAHVPGVPGVADRDGRLRVVTGRRARAAARRISCLTTRETHDDGRDRPRRRARSRARTISHPSLKDAAAAYLREQILTGRLPARHQDRPGRDQRGARDEPPAGARGADRARAGEPHRSRCRDAAPSSPASSAPTSSTTTASSGSSPAWPPAAPRTRSPTSSSSSCGRIHESFVAATDPEDQAHWNHEFHRLINRAGGSRRLVSVLGLLSRSLPVRYFEFVPHWAEISAGHHARILAALEARDAPRGPAPARAPRRRER